MGRRRQQPYLKQKLRLYADHNFPIAVVEAIRGDAGWRRKVTIETAADAGNASRDDQSQYDYCRKEGLVLVTLDDDFMDDRRFPFGEDQPGIIRIVDGSSADVQRRLETILDFLTSIPLPYNFVGDSKFQVSNEGAVMRGRDAQTREIKTMELKPGTTLEEVMERFSYMPPE